MTSMVRYRAQYDVWGVELDVEFDPQLISIEQIVSMFRVAGKFVGIGDFRPEWKGGDFGTFDVVSEGEFKSWSMENGR